MQAFAILFLLTVATAPVSAQVVFPQYPLSDTASASAGSVDRYAPAIFSNAGTLNWRDNVLNARCVTSPPATCPDHDQHYPGLRLRLPSLRGARSGGWPTFCADGD